MSKCVNDDSEYDSDEYDRCHCFSMQGTDIFESASNLDSLHIRNHVVTLLTFPGGDEGEDIDLLIYIDLHQNDLDDLREEYQPNLRQRFDGWIQHKA